MRGQTIKNKNILADSQTTMRSLEIEFWSVFIDEDVDSDVDVVILATMMMRSTSR